MEEGGEEPVAVGGVIRSRSQHIKKRALKNKALTISFDEKDLKDFVGGFHKRKKKRRKEAEQHIKEKERLRRIEKRKQRKQEREYVQGHPGPDENNEVEQDGEAETNAPVSVEETKTYDTGDLTIMVKTSEISREGDDLLKEKMHSIPKSSIQSEKKRNIPVNKKQPTFKRKAKGRSGPKPQKKRDKRKGKNKERH